MISDDVEVFASLMRGALVGPESEREFRMRILADAMEEHSYGWEALLYRNWVWCPPGRFVMGGPREEPWRQDDEECVVVELTRGFWLGRYPVTQWDYSTLMGVNPSAYRFGGEHRREVAGMDTARFPVETVSWDDAAAYAAHASVRLARIGALPDGYACQLPSEAQWEYACRAGTVTATAWGDRLTCDQANIRRGSPWSRGDRRAIEDVGAELGRPARVGSYAPNALGLYDMHGNVWEWCQDWYADVLRGGVDPLACNIADASVNRSRLPNGRSFGPGETWRVTRGGSYRDYEFICRSARRQARPPDTRSPHVGFRIALAPSPSG